MGHKILKHLEKKYIKEQPIDIKSEIVTLNEALDQSQPLEKYFYKLQATKKCWSKTKEPVLDITLKRIAHGHFLLILHL